jgi:hypothetical protein
MNETIKLSFSLEEVNKIMEALGQMPFAQVHKLIGQIHESASQQLQAGRAKESNDNVKSIANA